MFKDSKKNTIPIGQISWKMMKKQNFLWYKTLLEQTKSLILKC